MLSFSTALFVFILGFGFLIFVHELGHFLVAKWVGIRCTQFAIGFGPPICAWRKGIGFRPASTEAAYEQRVREHLKQHGTTPAPADASSAHSEDFPAPSPQPPSDFNSQQIDDAARRLGLGETEYRLNWLPLGGYVKMLGQEDLDPTAQSQDPRSFNSKSVGARFAVISAGVIMNMIFGVAFFIVAFMVGVAFPPSIVGDVRPGSPAEVAYAVGHENDPEFRGLRIGDRITHVGDTPIRDMMELRLNVALAGEDQALALHVERPGLDQPLRFDVVPDPDPLENLLSIGVAPPRTTTVEQVRDDLRQQHGVEPGMRVVSAAGQPVETYADYARALFQARGEPIELVLRDDETGREATVPQSAHARLIAAEDGPRHLLGLVPPTRVDVVAKNSAADDAGVQVGDLIAELDGHLWPDPGTIQRIVPNAGDRAVRLIVSRDGELVDLGSVTPRRGLLGVSMTVATDSPIIAALLPDSPAAELDIPPGSILRSINDQPVSDWTDAQRLLASLAAADDSLDAVTIEYELTIGDRARERAELPLTPADRLALAAAGWNAPDGLIFGVLEVPLKADNPLHATELGLEKTWQYMVNAYLMLGRLVQGSVKVEHLAGPVGIVYVGTKTTERGWAYFMFFLGLLSVNLAVINFLPIPIADGGHAVFLLTEKIKGSPVSPRVQAAAMYLGLAFLALVFIVVTWNDITKLLR